MNSKTSRSYGGVSQAERIAQRREKLMQATMRLLERHGPAGAQVTAICAEAGLTARYFYESFANREELLQAVFEQVCAHMLADIGEGPISADPIGIVLERFLTILRDHPHLTRMFLVDIDTQDGGIRRIGIGLARSLVEMMVPGPVSPLARAGIAGAVIRTARAWIEGGTVEPMADVVALARRFVAAGAGSAAVGA